MLITWHARALCSSPSPQCWELAVPVSSLPPHFEVMYLKTCLTAPRAAQRCWKRLLFSNCTLVNVEVCPLLLFTFTEDFVICSVLLTSQDNCWGPGAGARPCPRAGHTQPQRGRPCWREVISKISVQLAAHLGHRLWVWDDKSPQQLGDFCPASCSSISMQYSQVLDLSLLPLPRTYQGLLSTAIICSIVPKHANI